MTNELAQFWDLPKPVVPGTPRAQRREVRTIEFGGQTCVVLYDLARCLDIDRKRLVKALQGRARLVEAIDVDGVERILIVVPGWDVLGGP